MAAVIGRDQALERSKTARDLRTFARRIDPTLRRAYTRRIIVKAIQAPLRQRTSPDTSEGTETIDKRPQQMLGTFPNLWLPSLSSLVAFGVTGQLSDWLWPGQDAVAFAASLGAALLNEFWLWPSLVLMTCQFRLMQAQASGATTGRYLAARVDRSPSGFEVIAGPSIGTTVPGDLVVGISRRFGPMLALVHLTAEGRQSVTSFVHRAQAKAALSRPSRSVRTMAEQFDEHCMTFRRIGVVQSGPTPLRSGGTGNPWATVVLEPDLQAELEGLALAFREGRSTSSGGLLLYGPPGTGKTQIARALASRVGCTFVPVTLPDLKGEWVGVSGQRTRELWQRALSEPRAVLFIDECDGLFSRRSARPDTFQQEILTTFLSEWDGFGKQGTVWVVGATNQRDAIDPAILSRFGEALEVALPSAAARVTILSRELAARGYRHALNPAVAEATAGMSGRDLSNLAGRLMRGNDMDSPFTSEAIQTHTLRWRKHGSTTVDPTARWDRLVLAESTLVALQTCANMLRHATTLTAQGIELPRGLLLYGPPGTGKTQIARTIAQESGLHFLAATTAELKAGVVGQSGERVRSLFTRAREAAPAVLFIDELDILAPTRGGAPVDSATGEIVGQLLQEMDGVVAQAGHVFVLAASNRPETIDPAVRSRFAQTLSIPLPSTDERRRIVLALLTRKPLAFDPAHLADHLAEASQGASGRDLRAWIADAEQRAVARALALNTPETVELRLEDFSRGERP